MILLYLFVFVPSFMFVPSMLRQDVGTGGNELSSSSHSSDRAAGAAADATSNLNLTPSSLYGNTPQGQGTMSGAGKTLLNNVKW